MEERELKCPICGTSICFQCKEEWHKGTCEEAMRKMLPENISFCPMCRTRIEKTEGCNLMVCRYCEFKFCWNCRQGATYAHFRSSELGCGVPLFEDVPDMEDPGQWINEEREP